MGCVTQFTKRIIFGHGGILDSPKRSACSSAGYSLLMPPQSDSRQQALVQAPWLQCRLDTPIALSAPALMTSDVAPAPTDRGHNVGATGDIIAAQVAPRRILSRRRQGFEWLVLPQPSVQVLAEGQRFRIGTTKLAIKFSDRRPLIEDSPLVVLRPPTGARSDQRQDLGFVALQLFYDLCWRGGIAPEIGDEAGSPLLDDDYLILSTIHSAKGQEWKTVYVLNVVDGCIPSDMAAGSPEEIEEEPALSTLP